MSAVRLSVVQRHDCPLCEQMLTDLERLGRLYPLPPIDVIDVDSDPQLQRRHGLDVPVLLLDGYGGVPPPPGRGGAQTPAAGAAAAPLSPQCALRCVTCAIFPYNPPARLTPGAAYATGPSRFHAAAT